MSEQNFKLMPCNNCGINVKIPPMKPYPLVVYCKKPECQKLWQKELERRERKYA